MSWMAKEERKEPLGIIREFYKVSNVEPLKGVKVCQMTNVESMFQESKASITLCFHHNPIFLIYDSVLTKLFIQYLMIL